MVVGPGGELHEIGSVRLWRHIIRGIECKQYMHKKRTMRIGVAHHKREMFVERFLRLDIIYCLVGKEVSSVEITQLLAAKPFQTLLVGQPCHLSFSIVQKLPVSSVP